MIRGFSMRITFITPSFNLSGGMRIISMYAERLKQRGHEVVVVSAHVGKPSFVQQFKSVLKGKGIVRCPQQQASHLDQVSFECRILDRFGPITDADVPDADVVIATWWETAEWVAKLSRSKGAKAYFIQHHEVFDYLPTQRVEATWSLPMHKIVVAEWLAQVAAETYGDTRVSCVPNGIDTAQFFAAPRSKQTIPTVGMMYAEEHWKGCDVSLKAFELAKQAVPDLHLVTFGRCPEMEKLPLPSGSEYYWQPSQDLLREIYSRCDVWLFGSRFEGFGLPILEAMACRTPVVGTSAGAAPELLAQGGGIQVQLEAADEMSRAIATTCTLSDKEWQEMSERAYTTAQDHSWGEATAQFEVALHTAILRSQNGDF